MSKNNKNKNSPSSSVHQFILDGVLYTTEDEWNRHVDSSGSGWKVPATNLGTENEKQCTAPTPVGLRSSKTSWEVPIRNPDWKKNNVTALYSTSNKNNKQDNKQKEDKSKNSSNGL